MPVIDLVTHHITAQSPPLCSSKVRIEGLNLYDQKVNSQSKTGFYYCGAVFVVVNTAFRKFPRMNDKKKTIITE